MIIIRQTRRLLLALVWLALANGAASLALAASVSFTIDPARSSYYIVDSGNTPSPTAPLKNSTILGVPVISQVPGGDVDALSGTISADETGGVLTFNGTSAITPVANPAGPFQPSAYPGTDVFGIITNGATPVGVISVVLRDWQFTIQSGTASNGALPSDGSLTLATTQGYQVNSFTGQVSIVGQSGPDVATAPISLTTSGGIETLVIPVIRLPVAGAAGQLYLAGEIVATRQVGLTGDVNHDGIVNGQDLALVSSNWLSTGSGVTGDVNGDGIVNGQDLALVSSNWLETAGGSSAASAVPEPTSAALFAFGAASLILGKYRGRRLLPIGHASR
jgi:hypothetical protein